MMADDLSLNARSPDTDGNVRRNLSETYLNDGKKTAFDSYRLLERSQSEIALITEEIDSDEHKLNSSLNQSSGGKSVKSQHLVSESSKVYFDLSNIGSGDDEDYRKPRSRISSASSIKQSLETIPQNEELILREIAQVSSDDETSFGVKLRPNELGVTEIDLMLWKSVQVNHRSDKMKSKVRMMITGMMSDKMSALKDIQEMIEAAWSTPVCGRDLAYRLCDTIREEDGLNFLIRSLKTTDRAFLCECVQVLDQIMTTHNRDAVVRSGLDALVQMTVEQQGCSELSKTTTGILESLFKHSEHTCSRIIRLGGLDTLLYWCRCFDFTTLRHCAVGLANLSIYGGSESQREMIKRNTCEWLFPLAFGSDDSVRYYTCLAISTLAANKEIEANVMQSGTMELVRPFITSHTPAEFAKSDRAHIHGRSMGWIMRLIPVLLSGQKEAQSLAAFHFAMEAGIKKEQQKTQIFYDIGAIEPLKKVARGPNKLASKLAAETLHILGEDVPAKLTQQVPLWSTDEVISWLNQVGFCEYITPFSDCRIDGDLLLMISDLDLQSSILMKQSILRKRFLRELRDLKISTDYSSCDPTKLDDWLKDISPEISQYTYAMLNAGIDLQNLDKVTEDILYHECHISYAIHRHIILEAIQNKASKLDSPNNGAIDAAVKPFDVFISYRRSNGSQLASLLKVHLQLRGFCVFLDIEKLCAGKFDVGLLNSISLAKHFVIVLTENSLERCINDESCKDWVHKEITAALASDVNIIPVVDNFEWPKPESLPDDMRSICYFNAIRWIHDYQDACVDKIASFLRGEANTKRLIPLMGGGDSGAHGNDLNDVMDELVDESFV